MKKIIRGIVLGILAAIVVTVAGLAVYLFKPPVDADVRVTVTDVSGNAYTVYEDESSGEKYAVVTDEEGQVVGKKIDENGEIEDESTVNLEDKVSKEDVISNYSGPNVDITNNINNYTGAVNEVTTEQSTTAASSTQSVTDSTASADSTASTSQAAAPTSQAAASSGEATTDGASDSTTLRITKYKDIFASNNYLMEFTTNDDTLGDTPITAAAKNGNIVIDTKIDSITCKMLYLASKDKTYLLLDNYRMYCSVPESLMGDDFDLSDMNMGSNLASNIDVDNIKTSTVTIDGVSYYCESCTTKSGGEVRYYFDGDNLVRFDTDSFDDDGVKQTTSTYFSKITTDVPDSVFEIPSNYKYINISWLGALTGSSSSD